jgi:hypothetical protein
LRIESTANHSESAFATASPVSVGGAVSLQRWPPSPHPMRSLAPQPSTFARATKAPGSGSGSARSAGRPCSRPKKVTNSRLWLSPWAHSPTRAFRHKIRSTTVADILGFDYRQGQRRTTRTPPRGEPCPARAQRQTCRLTLPPRRGQTAGSPGPVGARYSTLIAVSTAALDLGAPVTGPAHAGSARANCAGIPASESMRSP